MIIYKYVFKDNVSLIKYTIAIDLLADTSRTDSVFYGSSISVYRY